MIAVKDSELILSCKDFVNYCTIERKIYKFFNKNSFKHILATNKNGVRMVLIKNNNHINLYYCETINGNATIPIVKEDEDEYEDDLEEKYIIKELKDVSIDFFVENLGDNDRVITHYNNFHVDKYSNQVIKKILDEYITMNGDYLEHNKVLY